LSGYIGSEAQIIAVRASNQAPLSQVTQAAHHLASAPVSGYAGFSTAEIQVLGVYRYVLGGSNDRIWSAIVDGKPEAWMYAIHEAAEIEAFATAGIDFTNRQKVEQNLSTCHIAACIAEDHFLHKWASELGYNTTETALEIQNPIRKGYPSHRIWIARIIATTEAVWPDEDQEGQAERFFRRILP
jgi:hypothetical protein